MHEPKSSAPDWRLQDRECRVVLDIASSRWVPAILLVLAKNERGYNRMKRDIAGISEKMLSETLNNLGSDGLIKKRKVGRNGMRSMYSLTHLGRTLFQVLECISRWSRVHGAELDRVRSEHQRKPPGDA
jgi:DNA-binding HxlR family transcriptional regulator